jgi:tetratricopeptide (TPR) repeat protein
LASALGVLALAGGLIASVILERRAAEQARRATDAAARAEANLEFADQAIDTMLVRLGDKGLADVPGMDEVRSGLLADAVTLRRALLAARRDDPTLRLQTANTHVRLGKLLAMLGDHAAAQAEYEAAIAGHRELVAEQPASARVHAELGWDQTLLGMLLEAGGDAAGAAACYRDATVQLDAAIARGSDPEFRFRKANTLNNLGTLHQRQGNLDQALPALQAAVDISRATLAGQDDAVHRGNFARQLANLGFVLSQLERADDGQQCVREAIATFDGLLAKQPRDREYRVGLASACLHLSSDRVATSRAVEMLRELVREFPAVADYHGQFGGALHNLALLLKADGESETALRLLDEAIVHQRLALAKQGDHPVFGQFLENHYLVLASMLGAAGRHREMTERAGTLLARAPAHAREPYLAAILWSWSCRALDRDTSLAAADREPMQARCRQQAIDALRRAIDLGFRRAAALQQAAFSPLANEPAFQDLLRAVRG